MPTPKDMFREALKNRRLWEQAREILVDDRRKGGCSSLFNRELAEHSLAWAREAVQTLYGNAGSGAVYITAVQVLSLAGLVAKWDGR